MENFSEDGKVRGFFFKFQSVWGIIETSLSSHLFKHSRPRQGRVWESTQLYKNKVSTSSVHGGYNHTHTHTHADRAGQVETGVFTVLSVQIHIYISWRVTLPRGNPDCVVSHCWQKSTDETQISFNSRPFRTSKEHLLCTLVYPFS